MMKDFGLKEPFDIDGEELDGMTPQQCFVLGYEFATVCARLDSPDASDMPLVHTDNLDRIRAAAARRSRSVEVRQAHDDWVSVFIVEKLT